MALLLRRFRWLRSPLDSGPGWAAPMTLLWIIGSPAVVMMMPLSETLKLSLLLGSLGIWGILLGTVRPRYFWNNGLVADWRWAFGDYGVAILYVIFGLFAIGAAVAVQV